MVRSACAALNLAAFEWSIASGLMRCGSGVGEVTGALDSADRFPTGHASPDSIEQNAKALYNSREPVQMLANLEGISIEAAFILKDLHRHMDDPVVVRRLRDVGQRFSTDRKTVVLTAPKLEIPPELRSLVEFFDLPLPDRQRLRQIIDETLVRVSKTHTLQRKLDAAGLDALAENLRGNGRRGGPSDFAGARDALCAVSGSHYRYLGDEDVIAQALGDAGICRNFGQHGQRRRAGESEKLAGTAPRSVGRLGPPVWARAAAQGGHSWGAGMRQVAMRAGCGRPVEASAGEVRYFGSLRQIHRRDGEAQSESLPGGGGAGTVCVVDR